MPQKKRKKSNPNSKANIRQLSNKQLNQMRKEINPGKQGNGNKPPKYRNPNAQNIRRAKYNNRNAKYSHSKAGSRNQGAKRVGNFPERSWSGRVSTSEQSTLAAISQAAQYSVPYSAGKGSILSRWRETRVPFGPVIVATSDNIYQRRMYFDPMKIVEGGSIDSTQLEDHAGITSAGAEPAAGYGLLYRAMVKNADQTHMKDWIVVQVAQFLEGGEIALQLIVDMAYMLFNSAITKMMARGSTTVGLVWVEEDINSFLAALDALDLEIPAYVEPIARALCVHWIASIGVEQRDIEPLIVSPIRPGLTLAYAKTLRDAIASRQIGIRKHAQKNGLKTIKLNQALIRGLMHQINPTSEEGLFWLMHMIYTYDDGGVEKLVDMLGNATPWERITNATTSYTERVLIFEGDNPIDQWALIDSLLYEYDANYNKRGSIYIPVSAANDKVSWNRWNTNFDTNASTVDYPGEMEHFVPFSGPARMLCKYNDGTAAAQDFLITTAFQEMYGREFYMVSSLSKSQWDNFELIALKCYFNG